MRLESVGVGVGVAMLASAFVGVAPVMAKGGGITRPALSWEVLDPGAVYEARLQIAPNQVSGYLADYYRWFLPVDQRSDSGRQLLNILLREPTGDDIHNVVFVFHYDSRYKQDYYCKHSRAFFLTHRSELFGDLDAAATRRLMRQLDPETCRERGVPSIVEDAIAGIESLLHTRMLADEATWSFPINLCKQDRAVHGSRAIRQCPSSTLRAPEMSAIQEVRVQVPFSELPDFLAQYTQWQLPVDQRSGNGRRLVSVQLRDFGGPHDVQFVYAYEVPREEYACTRARAFLAVHRDALQSSLGDSDLSSVTAALDASTCARDGVPAELDRTIQSLTSFENLSKAAQESWYTSQHHGTN